MPDLHADYLSKKGRESGEPEVLAIIDWNEIRNAFVLSPSICYLNSGTEGSMPIPVLEGYDRYLYNWASNPSYYFAFDKTMQDTQIANRKQYAAFLKTTYENVCLTDNTSEGLSMVIFGLPLQAGDEVLSTLQDYPSAESAFHVLETRGIAFRQVNLPTPATSVDEMVDAIKQAITPNTKLVCLSHIYYTTGVRFPVKEICDYCREIGVITLIDGAHAMGMIDLDLPALNCDFYAAAGHKWLNGSPGTGILYIRDAIKNPHGLKPIISELYGFDQKYTITRMLQVRGCSNAPAFTATLDAVHFVEGIGIDNIQARIFALNAYVKSEAIRRWGTACLLSPSIDSDPALHSGIASFVPSNNPDCMFDEDFITNVANTLIETYSVWIRYVSFPLEVNGQERMAYVLRVSTHIYNTHEEIDYLFESIEKILSES